MNATNQQITTQPCDLQPVIIPMDEINSTVPAELRRLKHQLETDEKTLAGVELEVEFEEHPLEVQETTETIQEAIKTVDFLDAGRLIVTVKGNNCSTVDDALSCCEERAERNGVTLDVQQE